MAKIEGTDFSNVEEIKSELEFYSAVLSSHKELFSSNSGFDLYFFNEIDADLSNFSEKDFYVNKLDRIIASFDKMEEAFNPKTHKKHLIKSKERILEILEQKSISTTEIDLITKILNSMELDKSFYDANSRKRAFIEDSIKNLPKSQGSIDILKQYKILNQTATLISSVKTVGNRVCIGNNIYFSNSKKNIRLIYAGNTPFPMVGYGSKEIWKKTDTKWDMISTTMAWIS